MARKSPASDVIRALFAKSGNRCAFPGCTHILVNQSNEFVAQVCHIEAASEGGERWRSDQTDEERRSYENLLLLCYQHHIETNNEKVFTVEKLKFIKNTHEAEFHRNIFKIDESLLYKIKQEMDIYWSQIEILNTMEHVCAEYAIPVNTSSSYFEIHNSACSSFSQVEKIHKVLARSDDLLMADLIGFMGDLGYDIQKIESVPYYENPFINRNWETMSLTLNNTMAILRVSLFHMELKYMEEYLKTNSDDLVAWSRFEMLKNEFKIIVQSAGIAD